MKSGVPVEKDEKAAKSLAPIVPDRTIALVGLMGAGKSSVGRRLADRLDRPFFDSDDEIEAAAGLPIPDIFDLHGEEEFRRVERRVIERLLTAPPHVLATGGGAFMDAETRALMAERAVTIWLDADLDVLWRRVARRDDRPLLQTDDPKQVLRDLMKVRAPVYAKADIHVKSEDGPHARTVEDVLKALQL